MDKDHDSLKETIPLGRATGKITKGWLRQSRSTGEKKKKTTPRPKLATGAGDSNLLWTSLLGKNVIGNL